MFDFENPFKEEEDEILEQAAPDWQDAEWDEVCDDPEHQAAGDAREAARIANQRSRREMFDNFYEKTYRRRRERFSIAALRFAGLALCCGLLAYVCNNHGIDWAAWILYGASWLSAVLSAYGFGIVHEMGR